MIFLNSHLATLIYVSTLFKFYISFLRGGGPYLSPDLPRGQKSISPAIDLVGRVLREQGLGRHIDDDFIAAATTEMQEAMNMTPAEFEAAAAQLLAAENEGAFR